MVSCISTCFALAMSTLVVVSHAQDPSEWVRFNLTAAAKANGALCLDGSVGGGYIRKGDPKRWLIFHNGESWCNSDSACFKQSKSPFGSSNNWKPTNTDNYDGSALFASSPFSDFTIVFARACDGGSWSGNVEAPINVNNTTIYYRGQRLLDGLIEFALTQGLDDANVLLYGGCSVGALTAMIHADYVANKMPANVKTLMIVDGMYTINHDTISNTSLLAPVFQWGYTAWNATRSINEACISGEGGADGIDGWKCFFGATIAKYIKTPMFIINSKYDTWQERNIIGVDCVITQCTMVQQSFWAKYGMSMVTAALALPSQHGFFISNCPAHCQTGTSNFVVSAINGTVMVDAFTAWFTQTVDKSYANTRGFNSNINNNNNARWVATCDIHMCGDDSC